jgi:hypothetical protein
MKTFKKVLLVGVATGLGASAWFWPASEHSPVMGFETVPGGDRVGVAQSTDNAEETATRSSSDVERSVGTAAVAPFLREIERPEWAARLEVTVATPAQNVTYVKVDPAMADGKNSPFWQTDGSGRFVITGPDGEIFPVQIERTHTHGVRRFTSVGTIDGVPGGRAIFAYNEGELSATIDDGARSTWQLRAVGGGVSQWFKVDPSSIPGCGVDAAVTDPALKQFLARRAMAAGREIASSDSELPRTMESTAGRVELRILIAYTNAVARQASAAALQSGFDLAVQTLNSDFARSGIDVSATLVGTLQVPYAEDDASGSADTVQNQALRHLSDAADGRMDAIHAQRDALAADLVCLVQNRADTKSSGIAYILDDPGSVHNPTQGFSVVQYGYLNAGSVFSHEIGHNLGCSHDRENAKDSDGTDAKGAFSYSYGYRFRGADGVEYRTIMAYPPGSRLAYFSNPDITAPAPISRRLGVPVGQTGEADNARTIRETAFEVANYRLSTQSPANPGRLVNVSTRAFVGTGSHQLIAGFIITGNEPKRLLVRGVGPTLARFNVPGLLADPVLRIVGSGVELARNDNWQAADASTMSAAGAFDLPAGSRDSVLVVTLQPGAYTALLEGVNGTTGTALIEGYELGANGSRFANMSTRGFADKARPMIGGFVLHPDPANPGRTKRVVIRVLGPTLATLGVPEAMNDPMFMFYDGTGRRLLTNDDWSSGNNGGDDAKPLVRIYAEQQIAAAGLSPGNRRDSAVMVDLVPGAYTAVVTPFESLPDQPERPGVALVEVFEVNP